ncbi:hypothetical protein [Aliikangiella sp. G2MR2-5]|uniref:hypothetical protein n=1 Tax=Aliikangiella sp. G2MR2-5 TaxID=2788943 RepID=UPI0018AC8A29|nr:hypothetical protein [Aliikangiella sp. G2MR2-5]
MKLKLSTNKTMRVLTIALASFASFSLTSVAAQMGEEQYQRSQKELKIMSKIFEASLTENKDRRKNVFFTTKPKATYLAKQGMVFSFNFGRTSFEHASDWAAFGEGVGALVGEIASDVGSALAEIPEAPPVPEINIMTEEYIEDFAEAYGHRMEVLEKMREENRMQREKVRELQREIRSIERDAERDSSESERLKRKLESKLESLEKQMREYKKSMEEYRQKRDAKYTESQRKKSDALLTTLCDYGSTLRSLKSDEYVTLIFENYENNKDQVYVFEYDDVKNCDSGRDLLKRAISYQN